MRKFGLALLTIFVSACGGGYEKTAVKSWDLMSRGQTDEALKAYADKVKRKEDVLLRLMDEGILLRVAKRYEESNKKFFEAARLIEMNGYLSLGEQAITFVSNEQQTTYQGEDFEKVLIHLYLGLNFIELGNQEAALVEMRKVNEILQAMINNGNRPYEQNALAKYLGGIIFENDGDLNNALVSYRNVLKISPDLEKKFPSLGIDMLRMAKRLGMLEEFEEWSKSFGAEAVTKAVEVNENKKGSLVLVLETGKSPIKYSSKEYHKTTGKGGTLAEVMVPVAYYKERNSNIRSARLRVEETEVSSVVLNDVEKTAISHLKDRMGRTIAKAIAVAATKVGIATAVGKATKSSDAGILAGLALLLTSQADTRSWLLLPESYQIARVFLRPGKYTGRLEFLNAGGLPVRTEPLSDIVIKANKATFVQSRVFD